MTLNTMTQPMRLTTTDRAARAAMLLPDPTHLIALRACICLFAVFAVGVTGCPGPQGPQTYPVSGTITFDGQPMPDGTIIFEPLEDGDTTRPASGKITDGNFSFEIEEGRKRVKVIAEREVGEVDPVMGGRRRENYIPARYSDKSELTADVTTDGERNRYEFALEGK